MHGARFRATDAAVQIGFLVEELVVALNAGERLRLRILTNPSVDGDRQMLQLAFLDLLCNALAHNSPRGIVQITVGEIGAGVFVEMEDEESDDDEIVHDAQLFVQTDNDSHSSSMALARHVVEAHGGGLRCIDSVDRVVLVYLPLASAA
jgi:signal transduction histidine kinase